MTSSPRSERTALVASAPIRPFLSVVIPLFRRASSPDEAERLAAFLQPFEAEDVEVLICETGPRPFLADAASVWAEPFERRGRLRYFFDRDDPPLSRAASMNLGIERARGSLVLLFHLDCEFPGDGISLLRKAYQDGVRAGGFTKIYRAKPRFSPLHLTEWVLNELRAVRHRRLAGTNGIFLTRTLAREHPLRGCFLEDVELSDWLIKRVPRDRFEVIRAPVVVSIRKYRKLGVLRSIAVNAAVMILYRAFRVRASLLQEQLYHRRFPDGFVAFWLAWLNASLGMIAEGGRARGD